MSEIEEGLSYDLYDFTKNIYIFSHMKTNLVDKLVQEGENRAIDILNFVTGLLAFLLLIKILIIIFYILIYQGIFKIFPRFIKLIFITKCNIDFLSSFKNCIRFFVRNSKRFYTFNFYIFQNRYFSILLTIIFSFDIIISYLFNSINSSQIESKEKNNSFLTHFFLVFEFNLLIEIILYMIYSIRSITFGIILSIGYWISINLIIIIAFIYTHRYEYLYGAFILEEPQRVLNIIISFILMVLKINCLYKIIKYNKKSKQI